MGSIGCSNGTTMSSYSLLILLFWIVGLIGPLAANAQGPRDSRGSDFWLAVPPNDNSSVTRQDSAFLSLLVATGPTPTTVNIIARQRTGVVVRIDTTIAADSLVELRIHDIEFYQLRGAENPGSTGVDGEIASPASIHVITSHDVSLYALLRAPLTSDAWLVLPTDVLSTDYFVMSYPSDIAQSFTSTISYPSQFVVIATEDSTTIDIQLSEDRSDRGLGRFRTVNMMRGQSYLLQARVETNRRDDLTGSRITSTKPIAVLSGHRRAQVPVIAESPSRDCLIEQMPGVETWGKQVIVPPLRQPLDVQYSGPNDFVVCRVLASTDSTRITVNNQQTYVINKGRFWDLPLDRALVIDATNPVLVAILDRSANRATSARLTGDPSMIIVPPIEQYRDAYTVGCVGSRSNSTAIYTTHNLSIVIPTVAVQSLEIDGINQYDTSFTVLGTNYSVVSATVAPGVHKVRADSSFGVFVYGYGRAESYGYTGGMAFERLYDPIIHVRALPAEGLPGQLDTVTIIIDSVDARSNDVLATVSSVQYRVSFDGTSFVARQQGSIDSLSSMITFRMTHRMKSLKPGDTIGSIIGNHTLGVVDSSAIIVDSAIWLAANNRLIPVATLYHAGPLRTLGVCDADDRKRLFDPRLQKPSFLHGYYDIRGAYVGSRIDDLPPGVYFHR